MIKHFLFRWCCTAEGGKFYVPESIDSFVIDDGRDKTRIHLTERQKKSLENRLSTFSMRMKNKPPRGNVKDLFPVPDMKQVRIDIFAKLPG